MFFKSSCIHLESGFLTKLLPIAQPDFPLMHLSGSLFLSTHESPEDDHHFWSIHGLFPPILFLFLTDIIDTDQKQVFLSKNLFHLFPKQILLSSIEHTGLL